jgi:16S rRNA (uracil1498-N3)-methyltransferase
MKPPLRVPVEALAEGLATLDGDAAAYATRVHRLGPGDRLVLFDPERALEADAEIASSDRRAVTVQVSAVRAPHRRPLRAVTLIQGLSKGDKMDAVVRDATELSATAVVPALCARSVARPDSARAARWRRIAVEAARQCGRGDVPSIAAPLDLGAALAGASGAALRICLDPEADRTLGAVLAGSLPPSIALVVGPEGGLDAGEIAAAERAGFVRARMGSLILRTETVCAAVLGALLVLSDGVSEFA